MSITADDDYIAFCTELQAICGIDLTQYKRAQMERRLRSFYARRGVSQLTEPLDELRADKDQLAELLDRITINVSQLWRNPEQWQLLGREIIPELGEAGHVLAWSAGCSYGAEAYTLAAVCRDAVPGQRVRILGTDIDRRMVARARDGRFSDEDARTAPPDALKRHFDVVEGGWRARAELRTVTRFETGDLLRLEPRAGVYDLILCRNTVIYFTEPIRNALHARLAQALRPGGVLVIGSTERVADPASHGLCPIHPFMLRRV